MIGLIDAVTLAYTKLRVHRVRTWIAIAVSGVLFGLLLAVVVVSQGVFNSVESFSKEGFGSRYLISVNKSSTEVFSTQKEFSNASFVAKVEAQYQKGISARETEARRLGIAYDKSSDPSPIIVDEVSKKKIVEMFQMDHWAVAPVLNDIVKDRTRTFDPATILKGYNAKAVIASESMISPPTGAVTYMKNGKEAIKSLSEDDLRAQKSGYGWVEDASNALSIVDGDMAKPFIQSTSFDSSKGEIPVIIPVGQAEKLLKLEKLPDNAASSAKMDRLKEVRSRVGEITASFCYRNETSQSLVSQAVSTQKEIEANKNKQGYQRPAVVYKVPNTQDCGAVAVESDTRTAAEKELEKKYLAFEKKFNNYVDPVQYKINVRAVGVMPSYDAMGSMSGVTGLISMMFGSYLGTTNWAIPSNLLADVPAVSKPDAVFAYESVSGMRGYEHPESFIAEFYNDTDARAFMTAMDCADKCGEGESLFVYPFGSSSMTVAEMKRGIASVLFWTVVVVSAIAMIILAGTVGRTIAEGRRETAIFRAIGARRSDISAVYTTYTLMLALRIVVFALLFAAAAAIAVQIWIGQSATVGAQLAFGASDYEKQFIFIGINNWYLPAIIGVVVASCLVAMIVPLARNVRRNPIRDMRDDS